MTIRKWSAIGLCLMLGTGPALAQGSFLGGLTGKTAPASPAPEAPPAETPPAPADDSSSSLRPSRPQTPTAPTSPSATAPAPTSPGKGIAPSPSPAPAPTVDARGFAGVWSGTYTCAQGLTGVTFTFDAPAGGEISAVVAFYPVASNPGVPSGRFRVTGTAPAPGDRALIFYPDGWIERPPGYVMVGFELQLSSDDMALRATLSGAPGCTTALLGRDGNG
ncbi:hypothetical protein [Zavarzinia aquatilis]|nr:hypothetical protein [Zavarzinia aquatilis]